MLKKLFAEDQNTTLHNPALLSTSIPTKSNLTTFSNQYVTAATSQNTRRAYQADIRHFENWGGQLPASTAIIITYLLAFASQLNPHTLARRLTALKHWHTYQGFVDPTQYPVVSKTLAGIIRTHGKAKNKATPLLPEHLLLIHEYLMQQQTLRSYRDDALLQIGFFGAFRRSELVSIFYEHIEWQERGIEIFIPQSKTDQFHEGRHCAIPYGNEQLCPVNALKQWLERANINQGPVFCRIKGHNIIENASLVPLSINHIVQKRADEAGIVYAGKLSSHSLRRGLATSASRDGASLPAIMRQGRWKSINTVMEYIEAASRFEENASDHVLKKMQT